MELYLYGMIIGILLAFSSIAVYKWYRLEYRHPREENRQAHLLGAISALQGEVRILSNKMSSIVSILHDVVKNKPVDVMKVLNMSNISSIHKSEQKE